VAPWIEDNNARNRGCTAAFHLGLEEVLRPRDAPGHRYVILLNQDCYLAPDAVERALALMEATPRCAIAGIKQLASYDEDLVIHGGCTVAYPAGRHLTGRKSAGQCAESRPMPWVNGACHVVRVEALPQIGMMDASMFQFGSDSDWCYTARVRGWEVWYCAEAECVHEMTMSSALAGEPLEMFRRDMEVWKAKWLESPLYPLLAQTVLPAPGWPSILHGAIATARGRSSPPG
jgi:GT2 family glycosyltransferase